ncbi:MAG: radical SAM protein, partial [Coriobacteriales bacterium]|nr:radical SAM protein [Coriobacteriales bacterium]
MQDHYGRSIEYLRISLTDRCNLRCIYCMPPEGVKAMSHDEILRVEEIVRAVRIAADMGVKHIRLTGGEPLVRKGVAGLIREIKAIDGIEDISLTTNGILLAKMAPELKEVGLDRVNISLDTLDPIQFRFITRRGELEDTLAGIQAALDWGFDPVKVNAVTVRSLKQDYYAFARMSVDR